MEEVRGPKGKRDDGSDGDYNESCQHCNTGGSLPEMATKPDAIDRQVTRLPS
jgi:hypothetical protein